MNGGLKKLYIDIYYKNIVYDWNGTKYEWLVEIIQIIWIALHVLVTIFSPIRYVLSSIS